MIARRRTLKVFAVIGHPIAHSLSPKLHKIAFNVLGIDAFYTKVDVTPETLKEFMEVAPLIFNGLNVTIPHKERIFNMVDKVEGIANEVKAVNTVLFKDGESYGFNTDVIGVRRAVESATEPRGKRIAIIGAGGAARAAVVAFYKDSQVVIFNRTLERAERLAREYGVEAKPLSSYEEIAKFDIVINATPVGMDGVSTPIPTSAIRKGQVIMDMLYKPLLTPLLRAGLRKGAKIVDGLKMLVIQGLESERIWIGRAPSWQTVYSKLLSELVGGRP